MCTKATLIRVKSTCRSDGQWEDQSIISDDPNASQNRPRDSVKRIKGAVPGGKNAVGMRGFQQELKPASPVINVMVVMFRDMRSRPINYLTETHLVLV